MAPKDSAADSQLTSRPSQSTEAMPSTAPKTRALRGLIWPVTSGRLLVRCIFASMSRSR